MCVSYLNGQLINWEPMKLQIRTYVHSQRENVSVALSVPSAREETNLD